MSREQEDGPDVEVIRAILMDRAVARAGSFGRSFQPGAEQSVLTLVSEAALEIRRPGRFGDRSERLAAAPVEERVAEGGRAVDRLVDLMAGAAAGMAGYETDRLGEQTFSLAMSSGFCPCWPFC